ncbi:MAG: winged helix-turn-helix domain-containing protein [Promethearchaeota archaeon]
MEEQHLKKKRMAKIVDLLGKTKFQIFSFLNMYGKLSLSEIAQKLDKSKSTIHGHIKKMKEFDVVIEEKRPIYSDPESDKPKVFENVYSINPGFETEFNAILPELNLETLTIEQAKTIIDVMLFMTKIRIVNLEIQKQFFEKININLEENSVEMINLTKKLIQGLFRPQYDVSEDKSEDMNVIEQTFPLISAYIYLSPRQLNLFSEKFNQLCQTFYSEEFNKLSSDEKPMIFMGTGIPMKNFIEFLNK